MVVYNRRVLPLIMNTSAPTTCNGLHSISQCNTFSWSCVHWWSRHMMHGLTTFSILAFMLIQYTDSLPRSHIFRIPIWLPWSQSGICFCNKKVWLFIYLALLWYLCWPLPQMVCGLLLHLLPWQNSRGGISPDHVICQGPLLPCIWILLILFYIL